MNQTPYPPILYHYTRIENLVLILESRRIRFSRADKVNDPDEVSILDVPEIKKSVFLSCWTASPKESIPLWHLYASKMKGVRIELPSVMFEGCSKPHPLGRGKFFGIALSSFNNFAQRKNDQHWIPHLFGPLEVKYTKENNVSVMNGHDIDVSLIGTLKLEHWAFEEEYRFIIFPNALWNHETKSFQFYNDIKKNPITDESIDIPLDQKILDNIKVILGPNASIAESIIVDSLLKRFTKNGCVKEGELRKKFNSPL